MSKTFQVGDRVGTFWHNGKMSAELPAQYFEWKPPQYGVVKDITSGGMLVVQWDHRPNDNRGRMAFDPSLFLSEQEIRLKWSDLEREFKLVSKEVGEKVKEAAAVLREADKMSREKLHRPLSELHDVVYDVLYPAMDSAGWSTSSFGC